MLPLVVSGHIGIGDNIFQRAIIREFFRRREHDPIWLITCHYNLYWDFIEKGLQIKLKETRFRVQADTIARERHLYSGLSPPTTKAVFRNISYSAAAKRCGSILGAMFQAVAVSMPERPDFSLPLKPEWLEFARAIIAKWDTGGKPILLYRPLIVRREWHPTDRRNPDHLAYAQLYNSIRDRFFVVSISNLKPGQEWIVGPPAHVDLEMHDGALSFEHLAALFAEADLVFAASGFAPVLAEAVGTKSITVYGGRESSRTVQSRGFYAPHLSIDPDEPCDCHVDNHACKKHISIEPALERLRDFVERYFDFRNDLHRQRPQATAPASLAECNTAPQ